MATTFNYIDLRDGIPCVLNGKYYFGKKYFIAYKNKLRECKIVKLMYAPKRVSVLDVLRYETLVTFEIAGIGRVSLWPSECELYKSIEDCKKNYQVDFGNMKIQMTDLLENALFIKGLKIDLKENAIFYWEWNGFAALRKELKISKAMIVYDELGYHFNELDETYPYWKSSWYTSKELCEKASSIEVEYLDETKKEKEKREDKARIIFDSYLKGKINLEVVLLKLDDI